MEGHYGNSYIDSEKLMGILTEHFTTLCEKPFDQETTQEWNCYDSLINCTGIVNRTLVLSEPLKDITMPQTNAQRCLAWLQTKPPTEEIKSKLTLTTNKLQKLNDSNPKYADFAATEQLLRDAVVRQEQKADHVTIRATQTAVDSALSHDTPDVTQHADLASRLNSFNSLKQKYGTNLAPPM